MPLVPLIRNWQLSLIRTHCVVVSFAKSGKGEGSGQQMPELASSVARQRNILEVSRRRFAGRDLVHWFGTVLPESAASTPSNCLRAPDGTPAIPQPRPAFRSHGTTVNVATTFGAPRCTWAHHAVNTAPKTRAVVPGSLESMDSDTRLCFVYCARWALP